MMLILSTYTQAARNRPSPIDVLSQARLVVQIARDVLAMDLRHGETGTTKIVDLAQQRRLGDRLVIASYVLRADATSSGP